MEDVIMTLQTVETTQGLQEALRSNMITTHQKKLAEFALCVAHIVLMD